MVTPRIRAAARGTSGEPPAGQGGSDPGRRLLTPRTEEEPVSHAAPMLRTHPHPTRAESEAVVACIEACLDCVEACKASADACLAEDHVQELVGCILPALDCADVCGTTSRVLSRQTGKNIDVVRAQLKAVFLAARACAAECEQHADEHDHARVCAEACRRCEEACHRLLQRLPMRRAGHER